MEQLPNGLTLEIPAGAFPLSTDSMVLSDFVRLSKNARVLDLGSGCGTLGLLLCAKDPGCHVTGAELDPVAHQGAVENIRRNGLTHRMESICTDLRTISVRFPPGQFSCCVSNPPYFSGGHLSQQTPLARRSDTCLPQALMESAAWALKYGGDFFLVQKPENLATLLTHAGACGLEGKRLLLLRHHPGAGVNLIALHLRKGAKPGLVWQEETLFTTDGRPTEYYRRVYHMSGD